MLIFREIRRLLTSIMTPQYALRAWYRASDHAVSSMVEANRAVLAAVGSAESDDGESIPSVDGDPGDCRSVRTITEPDGIDVGEEVTFSKTLSSDDIAAFAQISGDTNRLHTDEEFAAGTRFGERVVHGTLVSGLISAALARLPGVTVYLSQDLEFVAPAPLGTELTARVEVLEELGNDQYRLETTVETDEERVIDGEAVVLVDQLPDEGDEP